LSPSCPYGVAPMPGKLDGGWGQCGTRSKHRREPFSLVFHFLESMAKIKIKNPPCMASNPPPEPKKTEWITHLLCAFVLWRWWDYRSMNLLYWVGGFCVGDFF